MIMRIPMLAQILKSDHPAKIEVDANDSNGSLARILNYIRHCGNVGHSFSIIVDPDGDATKTFSWDGDGSDRINQIKVNGKILKAAWDESKHPRADNGQFGSGSGGSKKPSKTRRKMERREEAASQARVGGAIQSLLSGGSALDKIGWFKQPEKKPERRQEAPRQPEKPKAEEKPSQAFNPDDISWSKPASYDGIKQIYPIIRNTGVSSSNLGLGMGIRIDQSGKDAWRVKLLYTGFDKNGHYTSRSVFLGEPGPLRQIKANVKGMMTDNDRLNKLVAELKRRQNELKN